MIAAEDFPQPPECSQIAHAGRRLTQAKSFGDLAVRQVFLMPHEDDLAVVFGEVLQSGHESRLQFATDRGRRWREFVITQLPRQIERRLVRVIRIEPLLAIDAAALGRPVPTMHVDQPVLCELPQPQVKRHGRVFDVITHPLARFEQDVLHNIAGVDARGNSPIQSHIHHFAKGFTVAVHEVIDCGRLAVPRCGEQLSRLFRIRPHV